MQAGRLPTWRSAIENPQPLARALCVVAAIVLVVFELWPALSAQFATPSASNPRSAAAVVHTAANIEQITAADLFGHAANPNGTLPQTDLQVTLRAVFAASDPQAASAVIETGDGGTQMVKVGGAIGSAATLQSVFPNRVVLSRNGALETLYFPAPEESVATAMAQTPQLPGTPDSATADQPAGASSEEIKRAAILQRLEELRAHTPR